MNGNWGFITGILGLITSVITIVSVIIAIGQYKGKTDQKIINAEKNIDELQKGFKEHEKQALLTETKLRDEFKEEATSLRKDLAQSTNAMQDLKVLFTNFSSKMDTQMQYIQGDLKDIKEKFNAKEK
ncbi:hypothetical protein [Treponema sp.]|uniref:hypothetical protein n=1 Tax=Treponema sp. TaxID=166 RepID=UPI00298E68EF|nr:hypothetical protein [Treponema sp.]MCQ2242413.1 hypothetical protein [Treponema sp.]